jgi:ABC-type Fe3+/spermidine/putrescine transport system ATPase subunit
MSVLEVKDLCFARGNNAILAGLTFEHHAGTVLSALGPSGSGKTTLLWLLAGLLKPDHGTIRHVNGPPNLPRIGFVFQDGALWNHLTVEQHLDLVLRAQRLERRVRIARIAESLERTHLAGMSRRRPQQLSGGERQRLALARAMVIQPDLLLLDEPTSQLDGPSRDALICLLEEQLRATRAAVILATHQVDLALRLSDRVAVLLDGQLAQVASPTEIYARPVNLDVARLVGPASQLDERSRGLVENLNGNPAAIVRPHQAQFRTDPAGPWRVISCHAAGPHHQLELEASPNAQLLATSPTAIAPGARGCVRWVDHSQPS